MRKNQNSAGGRAVALAYLEDLATNASRAAKAARHRADAANKVAAAAEARASSLREALSAISSLPESPVSGPGATAEKAHTPAGKQPRHTLTANVLSVVDELPRELSFGDILNGLNTRYAQDPNYQINEQYVYSIVWKLTQGPDAILERKKGGSGANKRYRKIRAP